MLAGHNPETYLAPKGIPQFLHMLKTLNLFPPTVMVGESHLYAHDLYSAFPPDLLINFDTHPDMSDKHPEYLDCENWLYWLLRRHRKMRAIWVAPDHANLTQVENLDAKMVNFSYVPYSTFADVWSRQFAGRQEAMAPKMIGYICRSGAWTPPWYDNEFFQFVDAMSAKKMWSNGKPLVQRSYTAPTQEEIEGMKAQMKKAFGDQK